MRSNFISNIINTPWHLMRWVRLIVGLWAISNFVRGWNGADTNTIEYLVLGAGIYFTYKALFNTGCEVVHTTTPTDQEDDTTTVDYEEIK